MEDIFQIIDEFELKYYGYQLILVSDNYYKIIVVLF